MGLRTPLYDLHVQAGAKIVDFGGWDMPVVYASINEEHLATRSAAGLFDVSHMGRLWFAGPRATEFLDHLLTNQVATMKPGQARYSLILGETGCILDDVLVYRLGDRYLMVVNASNRDKILAWLNRYRDRFDVDIQDATNQTAMVAVQGPLAMPMISARLGFDPSQALNYYTAMEHRIDGKPVVVSRTGYTGEDGVELIGPPDVVGSAWKSLIAEWSNRGVRAAGLGARDTLRLEASMPLYGHELTESIDPIQSGLAWAVKSKAKDFVGKQAMLDREPQRPVRVGLELEGKRIARENFPILADEMNVGWISSGTFAPTLKCSIAMGYVQPRFADMGQRLDVDIRGVRANARVVPMPFYRRNPVHGATQ